MAVIQSELQQQTPHAFLKLAVFGGIDDRVNEAVGQHQQAGEAIVPGCVVDVVAAGEVDSQ